jgi:hypothetical protein
LKKILLQAGVIALLGAGIYLGVNWFSTNYDSDIGGMHQVRVVALEALDAQQARISFRLAAESSESLRYDIAEWTQPDAAMAAYAPYWYRITLYDTKLQPTVADAFQDEAVLEVRGKKGETGIMTFMRLDELTEEKAVFGAAFTVRSEARVDEAATNLTITFTVPADQ